MKKIKVQKEILKCLVGSHNYNLQTKDSDKDYKSFVLSKQIRSKIIIGNEEDREIHDIRRLPELLWSSNPNYLEAVFSKEITYDKEIFPEISEIVRIRNSIAKMNLPNLYNSCKGAFFNRIKNLKNGTEVTKDLVKKHGYDTKRALHAYRYLDLIIRFAYTNFNDFIYAIRYERRDEKEFMLSIKNGNYSIDEFLTILEIKYITFEKSSSKYFEQKKKLGTKTLIEEEIEKILINKY